MTEAEEAAAAWGARLVRKLAERENAVYQIALADGTRAALRLHRPGYRDAAVIRSELWWCGALADGGLPVPRPLPSLQGALLCRVGGARLASVLSWVEGAPIGLGGMPLPGTRYTQARTYRALGQLLAHLHSATDRLTLPPDFTLPHWTIEGIVGETPLWGRFWEHPLLTGAEARRLREVRAHLSARLTTALPNADIGPIHADVLRENVFVNDGSLSLIDFDDSGIGFRAHDLGTALSQNLSEPAFPEIRAALIDGYAEHRACDPDLVDTLTLARCAASVGWMIPRLGPDDPAHRRFITRALDCAARVMGP